MTARAGDSEQAGSERLWTLGRRNLLPQYRRLVTLMGQYTGVTMLFVVDRYPVSAGAPDEVNKPM